MFNNWCRGAIDKAMTLHVNGLGFDSCQGKFFLFFLVALFCFYHNLPLGRFQFSHIASPHYSFARHSTKQISSIKVAQGDA